MAATITTAPASLELAGNDNFVTLESDLVNTDSAARFDIDFSDGPSLAETLELTWPGQSITLTVDATKNSTATAIPTRGGGESLADYAERVAEALRENGTINQDFQVLFLGTVGSDERVRLLYRNSEVLDLDATSTLSNTTVTATDGTDPNTESNLAAMLQVWQAAADPNDDQLLITLHAPYRSTDGRCTLNLQGLFPVSAALPLEASIDPAIFTVWPHGEATGAWVEYYLRYADKYGTPAVPEALIKTPGNYHVIHGANPGDFPDGFGTISSIVKCFRFNYLQEGSLVEFRKPVTLNQPDWVYLWTKSAITDCSIELAISWTNGDGTVHAVGGDPFDLDQHKVYWLASGPLQHNMDGITPPATGARPWYYTWRLKGNAGLGEGTIAEVKYLVRDCGDWPAFLLLDNGLGGMESVLLLGKKTVNYSATRDILRRVRTEGHTVATGDLYSANAEGSQEIEANTGWHERPYIEHLRQLLLGDVWLIDTELKRFLRVVIATDSIEVSKDDSELYNLSFTYRAGWIDRGVNNP